ncbi:PAC2 family protein [Tepidiforma sp.]|uniref:PAC2 family protein n=1 Tax=Tepidiforma sp. TaxID=2682230 RepID=UPI002ADE2CD3|nr:PAC2 family protein [Tepidiforma sp.]
MADFSPLDGFAIEPLPETLRAPIVLLAFTGWSDTGTVTTDAVDHIAAALGARSFLSVDPEDYYVFTETRPTVHITEDGIRQLRWPENRGLYAAGSSPPLVLIRGVEPNLRWRTFGTRIAETIAALDPFLVCSLVARPAPTPHTRPIPVTGSSADPRLAARYGLGRSLYQGPTGILGVIHDLLRQRNVDLISLAAGVPHYLNTDENPPATLALVRALQPILGFAIPEGDLPARAELFLRRVEDASAGDDQIETYVRTLEAQYEDDEDDAAEGEDAFEAGQPADELPSADDILKDVEDFLRGTGDR